MSICFSHSFYLRKDLRFSGDICKGVRESYITFERGEMNMGALWCQTTPTQIWRGYVSIKGEGGGDKNILDRP